MTRLEFRNRLCILRSIDRHELVGAGILDAYDEPMWVVFAKDPARWFLLRDDETAEKLWQLIERRALPAEINWNDRSQAASALHAGIVPPGCSINEAGALVIPELHHAVRGHLLILAHFDEIVTAAGEVVKSRNGGMLKTARAP
jgi:hypothetical protein